ncbi:MULTISPECIES: hypothetical protein [unclassified Streptomyces]|uniref:hypothetical protein n=1 Tax=unclassified Streptomyces TaxID=2593676 RepID=UPI003808089F
MPQPPVCPNAPCGRPYLWKDTTTTRHGDDEWLWWCARCKEKWTPSAQQVEDYRFGPSAHPAAAQRDPRLLRR